MRSRKRLRRRMYAVSLKGHGIIAGTVAYSRGVSINLFQHLQIQDSEVPLDDVMRVEGERWSQSKREGYRTVKVAVRVIP